MKKILAIILLAVSLPLAAQAQNQTAKDFDPGAFTQNLRFEAGGYIGTGGDQVAGMLQMTYTRNFWGPLAWRGGLLAAGDGLGYDGYVGVPLSLSYCPGTIALKDRLIMAAENSIFDILFKADFNFGHPRFSTTLDAGVVLSIPIRRLSIDILPTYHYSLGRNIVTEDGPMRHFFSVGVGLSWIF